MESDADAVAMKLQLAVACPNCVVHAVVLTDGLPWPSAGGGNLPATVKLVKAGVAAVGGRPVVVVRLVTRALRSAQQCL